MVTKKAFKWRLLKNLLKSCLLSGLSIESTEEAKGVGHAEVVDELVVLKAFCCTEC